MSTTGIIIAREYIERIKSKSFIIGTLLVVLGIFALSFLPFAGQLLRGAFTSKLIVLAPDPATAKAIKSALESDYIITIGSDRSTSVTLPADIERDITSKKYDGALLAYRTREGLAFTFYPRQANLLSDVNVLQRRLVPIVLRSDLSGSAAAAANRALHFPFNTIALNERYKTAGEEALATGLVYVLLILLYITTLMYGVFVGQGVVEEKTNRVMEILIGAVRPVQLLAGKIFGIGALALTQMLIFAAAAGASGVVLALVMVRTMSAAQVTAAMHQQAAAGNVAQLNIGAVPVATLVYLVVFFLLGFFSYAALFAGVGALCSKAEDVQQFNGFFVIPVIIAYMVAIFALTGDPDKPLIVWTSMVPLISPMIMFTRVAISTVPIWQIAASIGLSLAAIWGLTLLAAKLYRIGVLMYGKPPTVREIVRALRAPS
jgi:ABC-2 type transport system permease protein